MYGFLIKSIHIILHQGKTTDKTKTSPGENTGARSFYEIVEYVEPKPFHKPSGFPRQTSVIFVSLMTRPSRRPNRKFQNHL